MNKAKPRNDCLNCGVRIPNSKAPHLKCCSLRCREEYRYRSRIEQWKNGGTGNNGGVNPKPASPIRRYIWDLFDGKCQRCGWAEVNTFTGRVPLELHHIDGDFNNSSEDNLQLLCPNCHALTDNHGARNRGKGRRYFRMKYHQEQQRPLA